MNKLIKAYLNWVCSAYRESTIVSITPKVHEGDLIYDVEFECDYTSVSVTELLMYLHDTKVNA